MEKRKTIQELVIGDLVVIRAPFEENTRDYYNGYHPKEIRGAFFTDRFGRTGKTRLVLFLVRDGNQMYYLPLTSKHGSKWDMLHQYQLRDNSMTITTDPTIQSFVELDSLRVVHIPQDVKLPFPGRITNLDLIAVCNRLAAQSLDVTRNEDTRRYIPGKAVNTLWQMLQEFQFEEQERTPGRTYHKQQTTKKTVMRTVKGAVWYHVPMEKETVRAMIEQREGRVL